MKSIDQKEIAERYSEEVLVIVDSIQGLLTMTDYYQNHPETNNFLAQISTCLTKLRTLTEVTQENNVRAN